MLYLNRSPEVASPEPSPEERVTRRALPTLAIYVIIYGMTLALFTSVTALVWLGIALSVIHPSER